MRRSRTALSLIEVLVVIGVIGLLVGLLLPAVQRIREGASRTRCLSHLRQLALAAQKYHDSQRAFPPGITWQGGKHPQPWMTWLTRILPHLEQGPLWERAAAAYAQNPDWQSVPHRGVMNVVVPVFLCPTDVNGQKPHTHRYMDASHDYTVAFTSFLGVSGRDQVLRDGVLFDDSAIRIADITDGTTNTLLIGERPVPPTFEYGVWYAGRGQNKTGSAGSVLGVRDFNTQVEFNRCLGQVGLDRFSPGRADWICDGLHFWSNHPNGGNFAFADGSARFLPYTADKLLPALASRNKGEAVTLE